jgi:hypothetical protein
MGKYTRNSRQVKPTSVICIHGHLEASLGLVNSFIHTESNNL